MFTNFVPIRISWSVDSNNGAHFERYQPMVINKEEDVAPQSELHPKTPTKQKKSDLFLRTILVGIDFSTNCKTALGVAQGLAQIYGSEIILTHVVNQVGSPSPDAGALFTAPELGQAMAEDLERLSQQIKERGIPSRAVLLEGPVAPSIQQLVLDENPDLVVIGTHGSHGIERLVMGSTAEMILRSVSCPVMTVGPNCMNTAENPSGFQTILYATSLSNRAESALCYASLFALKVNAHIQLVHAVEQIDAPSRDTIDTGFQEMEKTIAGHLAGSTSRVTSHLVYGEPTEAIIDRARKIGADLLILEVHRSKRFRFFLPESTVYRVICSAPCPVLTVMNTGMNAATTNREC